MCCKKNRNLLRRLKNQISATKGAFLNKGLRNVFLLLREPLLNKGLRNYILLFCASALLLFCFSSCDKEEMLKSRWNLQTVKKNGSSYNDTTIFHLIPRYTYYSFYYENSLNIEAYGIGKPTESSNGYYKLEKKSKLYMRFSIQNQHNEFTAKIKKLTKKELHLEYSDKGNTYFLKLYTN